MAPEVTYLGFRINNNGVSPAAERVLDLQKMKTSSNVTQRKSFFRVVSRHLANLTYVLEPLRNLLRKSINHGGELTKLCSPKHFVHMIPRRR